MQPYGLNKGSCNIHPHNKCAICCAQPPHRGRARTLNKARLQEEYELYYSDDEVEGGRIIDIFLDSGFYPEYDVTIMRWENIPKGL